MMGKYCIVILPLLMLLASVGIAGAVPDAYVTHQDSSTISVIDTATNVITDTLSAGPNQCGIAITPDGTKILVTNYDRGTVTITDLSSNELVGTARVGLTPYAIAITPDGTKAYVTQESSGTVTIIDIATYRVLGTVTGVGPNPYGIAITPDGTKAYVTDLNSGSAAIIDLATASVVGTVANIGPNPRGIAITPDGTRAYIAQQNSGTVCVLDLSTDSVIGTVTGVGPYLYGVAITLDGTKAYVTNYNGATATIIDLATNSVIGTTAAGTKPLGIAITPVLPPAPITPVADFSVTPAAGNAPLLVSFDASASQNAVSYAWRLSDGTDLGTAKVFSHEFTLVGKHDVTLTVASSDGTTHATTKTVEVLAPALPVLPLANFTVDTTKGYGPLTVSFTDLSQRATEWSWTFGDGQVSTEQNPKHIYAQAGRYTVSLTATNEVGSNLTTRKNFIKVSNLPAPVARFTVDVKKGRAPLSVQFTDASKNAPKSWSWDFGDSTKSDLQNPTHTYSKAGYYAVKLKVQNEGGTSMVTKRSLIVVNKR